MSGNDAHRHTIIIIDVGVIPDLFFTVALRWGGTVVGISLAEGFTICCERY